MMGREWAGTIAKVALLVVLLASIALLWRNRGSDGEALDHQVAESQAYTQSLLGIQARHFRDSMAFLDDSLSRLRKDREKWEDSAATLSADADSIRKLRITAVDQLPELTPAECIPYLGALQLAIAEANTRLSACQAKDSTITRQKGEVQVQVGQLSLAGLRIANLEGGLAKADSALQKSEAARHRAGRLDLGLFTIPRPPAWLLILGGAGLGYSVKR